MKNKTVKNNKILGLLALSAVMSLMTLPACSGANPSQVPASDKPSVSASVPPQSTTTTGADSDNDGIPDAAEKVLGTDQLNPDTDGDNVDDMQDKTPTITDTSLQPTTGVLGFQITNILVENNYDSIARKDAPDHLEIELQNTEGKDISNLVAYYTITDPTSNQKETYFLSLSGLVLKAGETKSIHFDQTEGPDHFRANPNGLYYTSQNELRVSVTISASGYETQTAEVKKDAGGTEAAD